MFDPTVYDNLKVILEGELYDLDFSKHITLIKREDLVDLASMSRSFIIGFKDYNCGTNYPYAEIQLSSKLNNFHKELLEHEPQEVGCDIKINFFIKQGELLFNHQDIEIYLKKLWDNKMSVFQKVSYSPSQIEEKYLDIHLNFSEKFNEENVEDLITCIQYTNQALQQFTLRYG